MTARIFTKFLIFYSAAHNTKQSRDKGEHNHRQSESVFFSQCEVMMDVSMRFDVICRTFPSVEPLNSSIDVSDPGLSRHHMSLSARNGNRYKNAKQHFGRTV